MTKHTSYVDAALPARTSTYTPVGHIQLLDFVEERLDKAGFEKSSLQVDQNLDGTVIVANMGLKHYTNSEFHQEFSVINSYNKSKPVTFASGARVFACSNGMIISDAVTVRKHTTNVWSELEQRANIAIGQLKENWKKAQEHAEIMKLRDMPFTEMAEVLGRLFIDEQILLSTEVNTAARELRKPTFEDFSQRTLWSLYNACTFSLKEAHVSRKNNSLKRLHNFCIDYTTQS